MLTFLTSKSNVLVPHIIEVVLLKSVAEQERRQQWCEGHSKGGELLIIINEGKEHKSRMGSRQCGVLARGRTGIL